MMEWRPVPDYEGYYEVSDTGLVRSVDRLINGRKLKGKNRKLLVNNFGYYQVYLKKSDKSRLYGVHVLIGLAFINPNYLKEGLVINHKDGDKKNNHRANLEVITRQENVKDAFSKGLMNSICGENSRFSKLTWDQVEEIRKDKISTHVALGKKYNVTNGHIANIRNNRKWKEKHRGEKIEGGRRAKRVIPKLTIKGDGVKITIIKEETNTVEHKANVSDFSDLIYRTVNVIEKLWQNQY